MKNCAFFTLLLLLLASAFCPLSARTAEWVHLRTSQFELYTTNTKEEGRELLHSLAGAQSFMRTVAFVETRASKERSQAPVRILALRSRTEYEPFRLSPTAFGYFRHSRLGDYIVLQDIRLEHRQAAIHEYMHFLFRQAGLTLPLWLNEGLADFYSSLETDESQTRIGGLLPSRMRTLPSQALIDLTTLFAVNGKSPFYNDPVQVGMFYAESWALVHMLALDPDYAPGLPELIRSMSTGLSPETAFSEAYGKSVPEIQSALQAYLPLLSSSVYCKTVSLDKQSAPGFASGSYRPEEISGDVVLNDSPARLPWASSGQ